VPVSDAGVNGRFVHSEVVPYSLSGMSAPDTPDIYAQSIGNDRFINKPASLKTNSPFSLWLSYLNSGKNFILWSHLACYNPN
jgi:hypothetical protein